MSGARFQPSLRVVLGPTNTGKTHLAMERLLAHESGMIGLPLRLLAREVYDRCLKGDFGRVHKADLALITGEEKILPAKARYFICTTEAMPISRAVEFVAIDECQLAADAERGHVFTDRVLHARGTAETVLLGADTMAPILRQLLGPSDSQGKADSRVKIESRARFSRLDWRGRQKLSRLPRRTAIAAFSAENVYAIAEIMRRQRGGAAVIMGALSPRTRNAQVEMYQSGEVDFLVATDAIGMGLNMDVDHVAFAQRRKFDGRRHRELSPAELAQIAGRAGRHTSDGSFGVSGDLDTFDDALIEAIETHSFDAVKALYWRNPNLDFSSLEALLLSLEHPVPRPGFVRAPVADDQQALKMLSRDPTTLDLAQDAQRVQLLWQVAQTPDFTKTTLGDHAALIGEIFGFLCTDAGMIPESWLAERIERCDRRDGDLDTLSMRLAHIRTWTYLAQRQDWLADPAHWQGVSRSVEDRLSDALHMKLMGRFVDRKTSALMRRLTGREDIVADIEDNGDILVAGEYMGRLQGLHVERDPRLKGVPAGTARGAVEKAVGEALRARARAIAAASDDAFSLTNTGAILWNNAAIAKITIQTGKEGDRLAYLTPAAQLIGDDVLTGAVRTRAQARVTDWLRKKIADDLAPLTALQQASEIEGLARGLAFQLLENKGNLARRDIADIVAKLDQNVRAQLRKRGVRFGFYTVFMPALLKPAPARLLALLCLIEANHNTDKPRDMTPAMAALPGAGLTSCARAALPHWLYRAAGFYPTKSRAIRLDMLERLADLIRPALAENKRGFIASEAMMSIMGCGAEELADILTALGYQPHAVESGTLGDGAPCHIESASAAKSGPEDNADNEDSADNEIPAMVTLWRPARRTGQRHAKPKTKPKAYAKPKTKSGRLPHSGQGARASGKTPRHAPVADPNSPFAVLKNLHTEPHE